MDRLIFFHFLIFVILFQASTPTKLPHKLVLKRPPLEANHKSSLFIPTETIPKDSSPHFYANVYMTADYPDAANSQNTYPMAIALYSSTTVLIAPTGGCQHFVPYDCKHFGCLEYSNNKTSASYPYFNAYGYFGKAHVYLDFANWNLETKTIFATSCVDSKWESYGAGTYGMLGMGVAVSSWANFRDLELTFSIHLNPEDQTGEISFSLDSSKVKEISPVTLFADNNWHVLNIQSVQVGGAQVPAPDNLSLLFDINIDAIGFPLEIYKNLLATLSTEQELIKCPSGIDVFYKPTCEYSGNITNLPIIYIHASNQQIITIPPEIYIQGGFNNTQIQGSVVLNIKAIDPSLTDPVNYVRKDFANYIYLDSNFFGYYYAVFNGSSYTLNNNTILLYQALHPKKDLDSQREILIYVGIFTLIALLFGIIIALIVQKAKRRNQVSNTRPISISEEHVPSTSNYQNFSESKDPLPIQNENDIRESQLLLPKPKNLATCHPRILREKTNVYLNLKDKKSALKFTHDYTYLSSDDENKYHDH